MNGEIIPVVLLGSLFFVLPLVLYVECEINCDVFGDEHDGHAHLTFEEFYAYYLISPNKWDIDLDSLYYNRGEDFIRKKGHVSSCQRRHSIQKVCKKTPRSMSL